MLHLKVQWPCPQAFVKIILLVNQQVWTQRSHSFCIKVCQSYWRNYEGPITQYYGICSCRKKAGIKSDTESTPKVYLVASKLLCSSAKYSLRWSGCNYNCSKLCAKFDSSLLSVRATTSIVSLRCGLLAWYMYVYRTEYCDVASIIFPFHISHLLISHTSFYTDLELGRILGPVSGISMRQSDCRLRIGLSCDKLLAYLHF